MQILTVGDNEVDAIYKGAAIGAFHGTGNMSGMELTAATGSGNLQVVFAGPGQPNVNSNNKFFGDGTSTTADILVLNNARLRLRQKFNRDYDYTVETNTGTDSNNADGDGDGVGDWNEVATIDIDPAAPQPNAPKAPCCASSLRAAARRSAGTGHLIRIEDKEVVATTYSEFVEGLYGREEFPQVQACWPEVHSRKMWPRSGQDLLQRPMETGNPTAANHL